MISLPLQSKLNSIFGKIIDVKPLSGGSINNAYQITTAQNLFFLKTNTADFAFQMFQVEAKGLQILKETKTIKIPNIIDFGKIENTAFVILDFLKTDHISDIFWEKFGRQLAMLHQQSASKFGLDHSNFIGSLPQSNKLKDTWVDFFIEERILPQIVLAEKKGILPSFIRIQFDTLLKKLNEIFPEEEPALIHGDLWSGNFIKGKNQTPILIDPSTYYGHREMDLAMSYLFGGFDQRFYKSYQDTFPLQPNFVNRVKIYQLYYLMVHVNLFGVGYVSSVEDILRRFV